MSQYINSKYASNSYRPKDGLMSPGLLRARKPFRVRNALTGLALGVFGVSVWAHSISAVKQDVFDDVDEEARRLAATEVQSAQEALADAAILGAGSTGLGEIAIAPTPAPAPVLPAPPRGLLAKMADQFFPTLLDPQRKTFIWGAPPVDSIGRIGMRSRTSPRRSTKLIQ